MTEQLDTIITASRLDGVRIGVIPPRTPTTVFPLQGFDRATPGRRAIALIGTPFARCS